MRHAIGDVLARIEIATSGYFHANGWFRTRATRLARDAEGHPMPWFTYPAAAFFAERVDRGWRVLEFGSGMGSLWWSRHVDACIAIEHDADWAARMAEASSSPRVLVASGLTADTYLAPTSGLGLFDLVIVDGIFRNECLRAACELVSPEGIIVLDDAQRPEYADAIAAVRARGFRWLPFHGPQPVSKHAGCTAILYRDGNIAGL